ncbi:MAG: aspartate/glutamate racemase family protein [Verrucomicrobia bacterium]|nr:aspartate/glutamate racemase family protein [Verrucomicrobiota bacterium]
MKRLGLIGSVDDAMPDLYCQAINSEVWGAFGPGNTANLVIDCVDVAETEPLVAKQDWDALTARLTVSAQKLAAAGAEALVVCNSAWQPAARAAATALHLPHIDMAAAMAAKIHSYGYDKVAVLGLRTEAEERGWRTGLDHLMVVTPELRFRDWLAHTLSLQAGSPLSPANKASIMAAITAWRKQEDVQGIVMARPLLSRWVSMTEALMPVFDAAVVHGQIAARWAIASDLRPAPPCIYYAA